MHLSWMLSRKAHVLLACSALLCFTSVFSRRAEGGAHAYLVRRMDDRTALDWQEVAPSSPFFDFHKKDESVVQTCYRMLYDDQHLYLQVICREPDIANIKAVCVKHDGPVWKDDCVEIFLDPGRSRDNYFQFVSNTRGVRQEGRKAADDERFTTDWNGIWKATAHVQVDSWICEVEIPFVSLDMPPPKEGEVWGSNVCRERHSGNVFELSSWVLARNFHHPKGFGRLIFGSFGPELERQLKHHEPGIEQYRRRIEIALPSWPKTGGNDYGQRFRCLENEWGKVREQCGAADVASEQYVALMEALPRLLNEYEALAIELELEELF